MFHLKTNEKALFSIFKRMIHHISFSNNLSHIMFLIAAVIVNTIIAIKVIIVVILIIIIKVYMLTNLIKDLVIIVIQVQLFKITNCNCQ